MTTIRDGTGGGAIAKVNDENRLTVQAESFSNISISSIRRAGAFSVGTEENVVSLTAAAGESGVLYFKNDSQDVVLIDSFAVSQDVAGYWSLYRNPTAGTLITGGTSITPCNLNFGSGRNLVSTAVYGSSGATVTDGKVVLKGRVPASFISLDIKDAAVLNNGDSFALTCEPDSNADVTAFVLLAVANTM